MTLIEYRPKTFSRPHLEVIELSNIIIREHRRQGFTLTLRQLYYQFIRRDAFPNTEKSYKRLGNIINDGRLAGLISWDAIEDRSRSINSHHGWDSPAQFLGVVDGYDIDMWQNQPFRPEVWVEKDALVGIVAAACDPLRVTYFACRGYVSQSEQWRSAMRLRQYQREGQLPVVFYLGDHDPSGIDMTRDHQDRLAMFLPGDEVEVRRLALNWDQVQEYQPPPNPAKATDSRFESYREQFGDESWELDALEPQTIVTLIRDSLLSVRNNRAWASMEDKRRRETENLREAVNVGIAHLGEDEGIVDPDDN